MLSRPALLVSLACSAIYTVTVATGHFPGRWTVKTASIAALAVLARKHPLLAAALALGSVGDALLDYDSSLFVWGLVAFLCGHIVYATCFSLTKAVRPPAAAIAGLAAYAAVFVWWLWPSLGALRLPVLIYIAAITCMAVTSFRIGGWVVAGALLFLISDSLLAANRFKTPLPIRDYLVWLTYYFGQLGIACGFVARIAATSPATVYGRASTATSNP